MNMNKALLVARREYVENLRTKTFWIGVFSFPIVLVLAVTVPLWLERTKAPRRYAVLDRSGWLARAVQAEADAEDLERVLRDAVERFRAGEPPRAVFPPTLQGVVSDLAALPGDRLRVLARRLAGAPEDSTEPAPSPDVARVLQKWGPPLRAWWQGLTPEEAGRLDGGLLRSRFVRVEGSPSVRDLNEMVRRGELFAYFVIGEDPVHDCRGCVYVSKNLADTELYDWFTDRVARVVRARRLAEQGLDEAVLRRLEATVRFERVRVTTEGRAVRAGGADVLRPWVPVVFTYLLWVAVFTSAQLLLTQTIEEKSSRVIEVLLSAVSSLELMTGKVLGSALTGLTMLGAWGVSLLGVGGLLAGVFGGGFGRPAYGNRLPPEVLGIDGGSLVRTMLGPAYLVPFLVYFLLGYLLYAALLGAIGSVCNTLREAQNLLQPVILFLIVPILTMVPIAQDPDRLLARVLSYVPLYTPFVMMNRAAGDVPPWEYAVTGVLLGLSVVGAFWVAARVFRIGILMTGQPPSLRQLVRLIRSAG